MENTVVKTKYDKAVEFMKVMAAIYDAMAEYKIHSLTVCVNGEVKSTTKIDDVWDANFVTIKVAKWYHWSEKEPRLNEITKPLESGVLKLDFTI